jgi:hypothetical protein
MSNKQYAGTYPLGDLTSVGSKIILEPSDNVNSVRAIVSTFKKNNSQLGWELKVVKDHFTNQMMILRTK